MELDKTNIPNNLPQAPKPIVPAPGVPAAPVLHSTANVTPAVQRLSQSIQRKAASGNKFSPSGKSFVSDTDFDSFGKSNKIQENTFDVGKDAFVELHSGNLIPRFEKYTPGVNNEEHLARTQNNTWANGALKFLGKTAVNVAGGTIGVVEGLINGVNRQSMSAVYDSDFNNYLEDLNKKLDYKLPHYYTAQEKDMNFGQKLGTANFWANDFLGGISFLTGTIISEGLWAAATGGTSLAVRGAATGRALTKFLGRKSFTALAEVKAGGKGLLRAAAKNETKNLAKAGIRGTNIAKLGHQARFLYTSAGFEAGVETRGFMEESKLEWESQFRAQNGRAPSAVERGEFNEALKAKGNVLFAGNVALVGSSNLIILGNLFKGVAPTRTISNNVFKKAIFGTGFTKEADLTIKALVPTKAQKILGRAYGVVKPMATEGVIEEGGQAVMSTAAKSYMLSAYDKDNFNHNASVMDAVTEGFNYAYGTKAGLTEVGLGALIGFFGGGVASGGKFNEISQEQNYIDKTVNYVNEFTANNLINTLKTSAKVNTAIKDGDIARAKGDLTGTVIADHAAKIALIEKSYHYQDTNELIKDFETAIDITDNATLSKETGLSKSEVEEWKAEQKSAFKSLADSHSTYLEFAEAYIGDSKIAGLAQLKGLEDGPEDLKAAIAYSLSMGEIMDKNTEGLAFQIKEIMANRFSDEEVNAITVTDILRKANKSQVEAYDVKSRAHKKAQIELQRIVTAKVEAESEVSAEKEGSNARAKKIENITKKLIKQEALVNKLAEEKELSFNALNISQLTDEFVTTDMLDARETNAKKLISTVESSKTLAPKDTFILTRLLDEYGRSIEAYKNFNGVVSAIVNQDTRVSLLNGWVSKLVNRKKEVSGSTKDLFENMLAGYMEMIGPTGKAFASKVQADVAAAEAAEKEGLAKTEEEIKDGKNPDPLQQETTEIKAEEEATVVASTPLGRVIDQLKEKINSIVKGNDYTNMEYNGELSVDLESVKPTEAEVEEYNALLNKINKRKNEGLQFFKLINKPFNKKDKSGLTKEETDRLKELNGKLNNWRTLSGFNENESSIAEILELINQLENVGELQATKTMVEPSEFFVVDDGTKKKATKDRTVLNTINSPDIAVAKKRKDTGNYEISHLNVTSLVNMFPDAQLSAIINGNQVDISTIPTIKFQELTKEEGSEFLLEVDGVPITVTINERQRLVINAEALESVLPESNIRILDFGNSSFMPLFLRDSEGTLNPLDGDFIIESIDANEIIVLETDKLYELQVGDSLRTTVNLNDVWNAKLIEDYKKGRITEEDLIHSLQIYVQEAGAVNNVVGTLRAIKAKGNTKTETFPKLYMIRKQAAKRALASPISRVEVGITVVLNNIRIGSPNLSVEEQGDKLIPKNIELTDAAVDMIEDFGYILNGKLFTNKNLEYEKKETIFARRTSSRDENENKKVPVVVFKYKNQVIVFPVSLNTTPGEQQKLVVDILDDQGMSDVAKIKAINQLLIDNSIDPNIYNLADLNTPEGAQEVQRIFKDLENVSKFVEVEDWLDKAYNKNNLKAEIKIAIDITDKPFTSAKGSLDIKGVDLPNEEDIEIETVDLLDNYAKRVDGIFKETEPFRNEKTESAFYLAFEENGVDTEASYFLTKRANVKTLVDAFSKKIPTAVRTVLGEDLIKQIKIEIKQFQILTKGLQTSRKVLESGPLAEEIAEVETNCK